MGLGLGAGLLLGLVAAGLSKDGHPALANAVQDLRPVGSLFLNLLSMVVIPLASVRVVVIDFCVPVPVIVVPAGRFEHFPEVMVKETEDVSIVAPPSAAATGAAPRATASTVIAEITSRFN